MKSFFWICMSFILPIASGLGEERRAVLEKRYFEWDQSEERLYEDWILDCGKNGVAHYTLSLPKDFSNEKLPCIVVVGGLQTGRQSLKLIPNHGKYIFVSYEYSKTVHEIKKITVFWRLFSVRKAILDVPLQLLEIVDFLYKRPWQIEGPISIVGLSFGAVFVPALYVRANEKQIALGPGIIAYGGAGMKCLIEAFLPFPAFLKPPIATIVATLFRPLDPLLNAPKLKNNFLIISGVYDTKIPAKCAKKLQEIIPKPKTIINLETGHLDPNDHSLILELTEISKKWLTKQKKAI